ncbi:MAG TPA: hydrogenase maturation nickel metallochaperone HypA [Acidimicrobiia bacterium]|jgi:Zn finger protein HypA/HybF involved in hydrogenase expression
MHEYSLATEILTVALDAAGDPTAGVVTAVHVTIGEQTHLDREVLAEAFVMAAAGTRAEGATLEVTAPGSEANGVAVTAIDLSD